MYLLVSNCPVHGQGLEDPSDFGYVGIGTTVASSGVTQSMVKMSDWSPVTGTIAKEEMKLNYLGKVMESREELIKK